MSQSMARPWRVTAGQTLRLPSRGFWASEGGRQEGDPGLVTESYVLKGNSCFANKKVTREEGKGMAHVLVDR